MAEVPAGGRGASQRTETLLEAARRTRGFMPDDEGEALYQAALRAGEAKVPGAAPLTFVEIGAWCGKSTVYLGAAAEATGAVVLSIDHHRGSEENQPGWEYHEPDLVDADAGRIDTLLHWRRTISETGLEASVVGIVGDSPTMAARWDRPLSFCFIDGGHGEDPAWADFRGWSPHVALGGWLAIHDVFPDPADGGRPPYELYCAAMDSDEFVDDGACGSLRVLRRVRTPEGAPRAVAPLR
jgi:MMP 1-O-methyltransferase